MDTEKTKTFVNDMWATDNTIVRSLGEYITIPNISPTYDTQWAENGLLDKATRFVADSLTATLAACAAKNCDTSDVTVSVVGGPGAPIMNGATRRTPIVLVDIPSNVSPAPSGTVLLYGHLDKQPGLSEQWSSGLGPYTPVVRDGKLYGRGGADDGYAAFTSLTSVMALRQQKIPHARCVILVESCEESGSHDLEYYISSLREKLGDVSLIVCLDAGCQNYEQLWTSCSLRGLVNGSFRVAVSREGVHSGDASGVIPSPFRIFRHLLSRLENAETGELFPQPLKVDIPESVRAAAAKTADVLGDQVAGQFPFLPGVKPVKNGVVDLILARTWESQVVVKGMDGIPPRAGSGNVLLPELTAALSFRLPPTLDSAKAAAFIKETLEKDPPYGAVVEFRVDDIGNGWAAPETPGWLENAIQGGSNAFFGKNALAVGEGGSIPFMSLLGRVFPGANFLITGVLGPAANAHGPDEFLHLDMTKKVTMCVANVLAAHAR